VSNYFDPASDPSTQYSTQRACNSGLWELAPIEKLGISPTAAFQSNQIRPPGGDAVARLVSRRLT